MIVLLAALAGGSFFWAYPAPGLIANGPAPMFGKAEDAALCGDALWVDAKGAPTKAVPPSRVKAARAVCEKAIGSLEPGVRVTVEGQYTLLTPYSGLSAFRVQGLVVRRADSPGGVYVGLTEVWIPANRVEVSPVKVTTEEEQEALWRRLVGKR